MPRHCRSQPQGGVNRENSCFREGVDSHGQRSGAAQDFHHRGCGHGGLCVHQGLHAAGRCVAALSQPLGLTHTRPATTNPSLVYAASQDPKYAALVDDAVSYAKAQGGSKAAQVEVR